MCRSVYERMVFAGFFEAVCLYTQKGLLHKPTVIKKRKQSIKQTQTSAMMMKGYRAQWRQEERMMMNAS